MRSIVGIAILACIVPAIAAAQSGGRVTKLLRETISIYDEDGAFREKRAKWDLPRGGIPVERTANGKVAVKVDGKIVYLRNSEILTEGVPAACLEGEGPARSTGLKVAASGGSVRE